MKLVREISRYNVRKACIAYDWYTCGDCEEYEKMLTNVSNIKKVTVSDLKEIATDIKNHSETDYDIKNIMFVLANECCTTFIED